MNRAEMYGELRELIGNPDPNDVTNRQLESMIIPALERLAVELKYFVRTDTTFTLVEDQLEYILPDDLLSMILVEWNQIRIQPSSIYQWDREGLDYRRIPSSVPKEYAIRSRTLLLGPPASAAAIATDPNLTIQYIASTPGMDGGGTIGLGNLDQQLVLYWAAVRYCRSHPSDENNARMQGYMQEIAEQLPAARKAAQNRSEDYFPHFHPQTDRFRGAR
jgi:hypothetical protein